MYSARNADASVQAHAPAIGDSHTIPVFDRTLGSWRLSLRRHAMHSDELITAYDRAASRWHRSLQRLDYPHAYETLLARVLQQRAPRTNGKRVRVLDCGVGTGALSHALSRAISTPMRLDALDISARMLEQAREGLRADGVDATFHQGDARALPFDDDVFDVTMSAHVLEHLPDPRSALAEMVRVTRPGGLVIACLTRRSALGLWIHLKWRVHMVTARQAERWMHECGVSDACRVSVGDIGNFRRRSIACAGTKR